MNDLLRVTLSQHVITIAVDPGKYHAGYAIFVDGELATAGVVQFKPEPNTHPPEYRNPMFREGESSVAVRIAREIVRSLHSVLYAVRALTGGVCSFRFEYVAEYPHVYVDPKTRQLKKGSNPQALMFLTLMSGFVAGAIAVFCEFALSVRYVEPGEWKGNKSDQATWTWIHKGMHDEEIKIAKACRVYDEDCRDDFHHGLEACGIGMWSLFRI